MPPPNRVPIADLQLVTPLPIHVGQEVIVDASGTTDVDGPPNKIKNVFNWGQDSDKSTAPGKPGKAAYARGYDSVGVYDIVYEVIDHKGGKATAKITIDVAPAETVPVPVDCVPGTVTETPGAWGACQPDGTQTRTVTWVREGDIPEQHGGAPCGPTSGSRVETQACVYVPPIEPEPGGYFETLVALPQCVASRAWNTQAELDAAVKLAPSFFWTLTDGVASLYKLPRNQFHTDPNIAHYGDEGDESVPGNQGLRVPLNVADGSLLVIFDLMWPSSFQANRGLLDGEKTTFVRTTGIKSYAVFRDQFGQKDQPFGNNPRPPDCVGVHNMTMDPDYESGQIIPPGAVDDDPYNPTGQGAVPMRTWWSKADEYTRYIFESKVRRPGTEFVEWTAATGVTVDGEWDMVSAWALDSRGITRLCFRVPVSPLPEGVAFVEWCLAFNTSTTNKASEANPAGRGCDGPLEAKTKDLVILHNYTSAAWASATPEQDTVIFQAP